MTKKDYIAFATEIRKITNLSERARAAVTVARVCRKDNPNFSRTTFYRACNVDYETVDKRR